MSASCFAWPLPTSFRWLSYSSALAGLFLASLLLVSSVAAAQLDPKPVPRPTLDSVEQTVRVQLEAQRRELDEKIAARARGEQVDDRVLAALFGGMGELYLTYDLVAPAEACLVNADALQPTLRWRYLLGSLYQLDNRLDLAIAALEGALALEGDNGSALLRLGNALVDQERFAEARPYFERALPLPDFAAAANYGLGRIAAETGDHELAVRLFEQTLAAQPSASLVHYPLAQSYRALGERDKMQQHLDLRGDLEVRYPDPIALEMQSAATGMGAWLTLGRMSMSSGLFDIAEQRFRKALEIAPDSAAAYRSLGSALQRQGRVPEAIDAYERAVELEPNDSGLRYFLAQLLVSTGAQAKQAGRVQLNRRAVEHFEASLAQQPDFLPGWVEMAGAAERSGDLAKAESATVKALELKPEAQDLQIYRIALLLDMGKEADAQAAASRLSNALIPDPRDQLRFAELLERLGDNEQAKERYRALTEYDSADSAASGDGGDPMSGVAPLASFHLGNLLVDEGDLEQAVVAYRAVIAAVPEMADAQFNLATVLGRLGRYREAAGHYGSVLVSQQGRHEARYAQAMALVLAEDYGDAKERLERALELYPGEIGYGHLLARLLVTAPDAAVRDKALGLELAQQLMQASPSAEHAETLAMALAENGLFEKAVELQQRVVDEFERIAGEDAQAAAPLADARRRLDSYRALQPVRSPWKS